MESISTETATILLKTEGVSFQFNPPFTFTSGLKSPIYLDNRVIMSYPEERKRTIQFYVQLIKEKIGLKRIDCISATATAAIPQGAWIADKLNLPLVYCRSGKKGHGKENQIEGHLKKGSKVLIVEDHISTGGSAVENANAIRKLGGFVNYCIATTTYQTKKSEKSFKDAGIMSIAMVTGKEIVQQAVKAGKLSKKEQDLVEDWFLDSNGWARRHGYE